MTDPSNLEPKDTGHRPCQRKMIDSSAHELRLNQEITSQNLFFPSLPFDSFPFLFFPFLPFFHPSIFHPFLFHLHFTFFTSHDKSNDMMSLFFLSYPYHLLSLSFCVSFVTHHPFLSFLLRIETLNTTTTEHISTIKDRAPVCNIFSVFHVYRWKTTEMQRRAPNCPTEMFSSPWSLFICVGVFSRMTSVICWFVIFLADCTEMRL